MPSVFNPAVFHDASGWHMLLEHGVSRPQLDYWQSQDGCRWTSWPSNPVLDNAGNAWIGRSNGTFLVFYGNFSTGAWHLSEAVGPGLTDLHVVNPSLFNITQSWEKTHLADPEIVFPNGPGWAHEAYLYYSGDQSSTGLAVVN
jgi:hypothetical protein